MVGYKERERTRGILGVVLGKVLGNVLCMFLRSLYSPNIFVHKQTTTYYIVSGGGFELLRTNWTGCFFPKKCNHSYCRLKLRFSLSFKKLNVGSKKEKKERAICIVRLSSFLLGWLSNYCPNPVNNVKSHLLTTPVDS